MRISDWSSDVCSSDLAVDARSNNTAYQSAEGIDLSARYRFDLDPGGHIDFTAAASYIESERRLIESEDPSPFAGVIFRSPHWRARGGATFEQNNVALSAFLQYVRSEEHTSELQSLMRISYAVLCLKTKKNTPTLQ